MGMGGEVFEVVLDVGEGWMLASLTDLRTIFISPACKLDTKHSINTQIAVNDMERLKKKTLSTLSNKKKLKRCEKRMAFFFSCFFFKVTKDGRMFKSDECENEGSWMDSGQDISEDSLHGVSIDEADD